MEAKKAVEVWHFENTRFVIPYCRKTDSNWIAYSILGDGRTTNITANPRFVTCPRCLERMKENGIKNIFTKAELAILKDVFENNHIKLPKDKKTADICKKLANSGHLSYQLGFNDEVLYYETEIGNMVYNAITKVYGDE